MKRAAIIQARMTSTRLPGKVLKDLAGRPVLSHVIRRLKAVASIDEIVVATTRNGSDDPLIDLARNEGVRWYRGSEQDVLSRYCEAAAEAQADVVARVTSDCPLLDPGVSGRIIAELTPEVDFATNGWERTFPRGLDTSAMHRDVLDRIDRMATSPKAREHVTWFMHKEHPELFRRHSVRDTADNSDLRWTVDTPEDLDLIRHLYAELGLDREILPYQKVVDFVRSRPDLAAANAHIRQKDV